MQIAMVSLAILCLAMSALVLEQPRQLVLDPAREALTEREAYVQTVLAPSRDNMVLTREAQE